MWTLAGESENLTLGCGLKDNERVGKGKQRSLYCRCGREKIIANGFCATCYTLKRQDEEYFGVCENEFLSETVTLAAAAEPQEEQAVNHCAPPGTRKIAVTSNDRALPWLSRQGASDKSRSVPNGAVAAGVVAGAASRRSRADFTGLHSPGSIRSNGPSIPLFRE